MLRFSFQPDPFWQGLVVINGLGSNFYRNLIGC